MLQRLSLKRNAWLPLALVIALWGNLDIAASTVVVTNMADGGPGSLRFTLQHALQGETIDLTGLSGTITLTSGQIVITSSVNIVGPGPTNLAISGNGTSRIFYLAIGTINISGLTITNGQVSGTNFVVSS